MKSFYTIKLLYLGFVTLLATQPATGQEKFNISVGLGAPELLNLGIRYQMGQSQLGLSAGFLPGSYDKDFAVGADYFYHFTGTSFLSPRRLWYGRVGLYNYAFEDDFQETNLLLLVPRIGKDFNFSPKLGISADAGVSLVVSRNTKGKEESFWWFEEHWENDVGLSLGFSVFYRL